MRESIRVTVSVPTYNRPNLVAGALASILNNSYDNFELIVVDQSKSREICPAVLIPIYGSIVECIELNVLLRGLLRVVNRHTPGNLHQGLLNLGTVPVGAQNDPAFRGVALRVIQEHGKNLTHIPVMGGLSAFNHDVCPAPLRVSALPDEMFNLIQSHLIRGRSLST